MAKKEDKTFVVRQGDEVIDVITTFDVQKTRTKCAAENRKLREQGVKEGFLSVTCTDPLIGEAQEPRVK